MTKVLNIITRLIVLLNNYQIKIPEQLNNDIEQLVKEFKNGKTI